jgi:hypothetical protein
LRRFPIFEARFLPSAEPPSPSCSFSASSCATVIEVVEIGAGVNSDEAAEAEKTAESMVWEEKTKFGVGCGTGWVTRVDQECLDDGLLSLWVAVSL